MVIKPGLGSNYSAAFLEVFFPSEIAIYINVIWFSFLCDVFLISND